jgi:hypothetical protein
MTLPTPVRRQRQINGARRPAISLNRIVQSQPAIIGQGHEAILSQVFTHTPNPLRIQLFNQSVTVDAIST